MPGWVVHAFMFLLSLWVVYHARMNARDMVWSLWASSYAAGYLLFIVRLAAMPASPARNSETLPKRIMAVTVVFLLFLFIHNFIHEVLFMLIAAFLPFTMDIESLFRHEGAVQDMIVCLYRQFWPIVIFTSISWSRITVDESRNRNSGGFLIPMPAACLIRLAITVFILAVSRVISEMTGVSIDRWLVIPLMALVYLPVEKLAERR